MRFLFRSRPKPFLDDARREWQFACFEWLLREGGGFAAFAETTLVLPTEEHFPDRDLHGPAAAAALFRRARDHAGMAEWPCMVMSGEESANCNESSGIRRILYDPDRADPALLVAQFARQLARFLVDTLESPAPGGAALQEPAVELAAVFMGFGVFVANASVSEPQGLNEGELAHALALFCLLRGAGMEDAETHLNPHLRKHLRLAARDLAWHATRIHELRAVPPREDEAGDAQSVG